MKDIAQGSALGTLESQFAFKSSSSKRGNSGTPSDVFR